MRTSSLSCLGLAVFTVAIALHAASLADVPFFTKGEGREALVVRSMLAGEGLVLPRRDGAIASKPPLFHWLAAASVRAGIRPDELAIRLPSIVLGALSLALVAMLGARWYGPAAGVLAAAVLASSREWIHATSQCRVDMTLTTAMLGAVLAWSAGLASGGRNLVRAGWIAAAAAMLAKGPVGLVLPLLVTATATAVAGHARRLRTLLDPIGIAAFAAVTLGWYAGATWLGRWAFVSRQLLHENIERFASRGRAGHAHPFHYYIPALAVGFLPWTLALPAVAGRFRRGIRPRERFLSTWVLVVLAFYSAAAGKRIAYLLPLFPPLALLVGAALAERLDRPLVRPVRILLALTGAVALVLAGTTALGHEARLGASLARVVSPQGLWVVERAVAAVPRAGLVLPLTLAAVAAATTAIAGARGATRAGGWVGLAMATILGSNAVATRLIAHELSPRPFVLAARAIVGDAPVCTRVAEDFVLRFYFGRPVAPCPRGPQPALPRFVIRPAGVPPRPGWRLALADPRGPGRGRLELLEQPSPTTPDGARPAGTP